MRMLSAMAVGLVLASGVYAGGVTTEAAVLDHQDPTATAQPRVQGGAPTQPRLPVQRPPRDPRALPDTPVEGTASVSGRVVDATSGQPIARARVRLVGRHPRSMLTDAQGVFSFDKVVAGPLTLSAEKTTYVPASVPDGRRSMRRATTMLAEGQKMEGVTISMWRGGAISGRVLDPFGDPVENVSLSALRVPAGTGRAISRFMARGGQQTNDIGEFRIARLEPGSYILLASPQRRNFGPRGMEEEDQGPAVGRTYYPGVPSIEQAQPITIEKGQSMTGLELTLLETTLAKVTGTVLTSKGEPVQGGNVMARTNLPGGMNWGESGGMIQPDGSFELKLQAGEYTIEAMPQPARNDRSGPQDFTQRERGLQKITVSGEAMSGVVITTGPGATASGRVVFEGEKPPPANLGQVSISFGAVGDGGGNDTCQSMGGRAQVNADGTFQMERLWGACQVRAGTPGGWQLKAVLHRGTDVTSRPIEFQGGQQVTDLQLVFTDRVAELTFEVSDDGGANVAEYVVLVFPVDKSLWMDTRLVRPHIVSREREAMMASMGGTMRMEMSSSFGFTSASSRVTATGGPSGSGTVAGTGTGATAPQGGAVPGVSTQAMRGLLPGDYLAIAVDDLSFEDIRDPGFLTVLAPLATRISVAPGESKSVALRRATLPDQAR